MIDKDMSVAFTLTPEERECVDKAFSHMLPESMAELVRNLLVARAKSELRHMIGRADVSRMIRNNQRTREYQKSAHPDYESAIAVPTVGKMVRK